MSDKSVTPFLNSKFSEAYPEFSPDGRYLAYACDESGRREVYVQPFREQAGRYQIPDEGGAGPIWSKDGKKLFYRQGSRMWVVEVRHEAGFSASKPRLLFEQPGYFLSSPVRGWDISHDGQRFLMVKDEDRKPQPITEMILVQNWLEELKQRVPVK